VRWDLWEELVVAAPTDLLVGQVQAKVGQPSPTRKLVRHVSIQHCNGIWTILHQEPQALPAVLGGPAGFMLSEQQRLLLVLETGALADIDDERDEPGDPTLHQVWRVCGLYVALTTQSVRDAAPVRDRLARQSPAHVALDLGVCA
jgi:hypothetical protein